ncbi:hypothetical protein F5Y10DRAFT_231894 [Nemania abortiva]|nr:hypothetical protein F5Y10DRAFT_231894 [Nemania abortiva]
MHRLVLVAILLLGHRHPAHSLATALAPTRTASLAYFHHGFTLRTQVSRAWFLGRIHLSLFRYILLWSGACRNGQIERTWRFHLRGSAQGIGISNFITWRLIGCKGKHGGIWRYGILFYVFLYWSQAVGCYTAPFPR